MAKKESFLKKYRIKDKIYQIIIFFAYYFNAICIYLIEQLLFILGIIKITYTNRERIPDEGPVIIACTHRNEADIMISTRLTKSIIRFIAKIELFDFLPVAIWFTLGGVIGIDRGKPKLSQMKNIINALTQGYKILIFPQGTRRKEPGIGELDKKGIVDISRFSKINPVIVPVGISYRVNKPWKLPIFLITVRCGNAIRTENHFVKSPIEDKYKKTKEEIKELKDFKDAQDVGLLGAIKNSLENLID